MFCTDKVRRDDPFLLMSQVKLGSYREVSQGVGGRHHARACFSYRVMPSLLRGSINIGGIPATDCGGSTTALDYGGVTVEHCGRLPQPSINQAPRRSVDSNPQEQSRRGRRR